MRAYGTDGWFRAVQSIVEERIRKAQEEGMFDNLPGKGKPLRLDDDSRIAPHLRASYRILRNAGILPPEMQLRKEISDLRQLLSEVQCETDASVLVREINEKILASNIMGGFSVSLEMDQIYSERVVERLRTRKARHNLESFKRS
ncbi:MAG: DUF1992 domain-containing protein [Zetaproteobacteria bacterium]|nr:DUF1992 domain-containing protein [Zetaproteobacteria bacterium]